MLNYKDIYSNFLDIVYDPTIEEFHITEDHKMNLFYMGMFLIAGKELKIVNDTTTKLYQNIYDYWTNKYREEDFQVSSGIRKNYFIATSGFLKTKREKIKKLAEASGEEVYFSTKNVYNYIDNFDYKSCLDNMENLGSSNTVLIKYDRSNISQYLELGVAYSLNVLYPDRKFIFGYRGLDLNEDDFGDKVVIEMQKISSPSKKLIK